MSNFTVLQVKPAQIKRGEAAIFLKYVFPMRADILWKLFAFLCHSSVYFLRLSYIFYRPPKWCANIFFSFVGHVGFQSLKMDKVCFVQQNPWCVKWSDEAWCCVCKRAVWCSSRLHPGVFSIQYSSSYSGEITTINAASAVKDVKSRTQI